MKKLTSFVEILIGITLFGCSIYSASARPDFKDPSIINTGASRSDLINQLGQPCRTYDKNKARVDVFELSDAAMTSNDRAWQATKHALVDIVTLGIGEFWGSEQESAAKRQCSTYTVTYGPDDKAQSVETKQWIVEPPPTAADRPAGYCGIDYHSPACQ